MNAEKTKNRKQKSGLEFKTKIRKWQNCIEDQMVVFQLISYTILIYGKGSSDKSDTKKENNNKKSIRNRES